ncbi:hypothetical protein [Nocardia carnea]|uniref:hypothetical protein n=1 Tax=Nocardia carnea TaxID=37328 RepID=UPI00245556D4|nr:hypothetical protein [Nocardia carnea]
MNRIQCLPHPDYQSVCGRRSADGPAIDHLANGFTSEHSVRRGDAGVAARRDPRVYRHAVFVVALVATSGLIGGCAAGQSPPGDSSQCRAEHLRPPYQNVDHCDPEAVIEAAVGVVFDYDRYGGPAQAFQAARLLIDPAFAAAAQESALLWSPAGLRGSRVESVKVTADDHPLDRTTTVHRTVALALRRPATPTGAELVVHATVKRRTPVQGWRLSHMVVGS